MVVHRDDGDVEEEIGDGAAVLVTDGEDELEQQRLGADVLHRGHERHLHVVHRMLEGRGVEDCIYFKILIYLLVIYQFTAFTTQYWNLLHYIISLKSLSHSY